jgi:hypothetical protein
MFNRFVGFLTLVALIGCAPPASGKPGETTPSVAQGKAALAQQIAAGVEGKPFTIVSFEKTNGVQIAAFGVPSYQLMYKATVNFPQGVRTECLRPDNGILRCDVDGTQFGTWPSARPPGLSVFTGSLDFIKSERGWIPN